MKNVNTIINENTDKIQQIGNIKVDFKEFDEHRKNTWNIINNLKQKYGIK